MPPQPDPRQEAARLRRCIGPLTERRHEAEALCTPPRRWRLSRLWRRWPWGDRLPFPDGVPPRRRRGLYLAFGWRLLMGQVRAAWKAVRNAPGRAWKVLLRLLPGKRRSPS